MSSHVAVNLTANFYRNLESIAAFLADVGEDALLPTLLVALQGRVVPNLAQFPQMGRPFSEYAVRSVEAASAAGALQALLGKATLREYLLPGYTILYSESGDVVQLLSIKHHRQLSFDFDGVWEVAR